MLFHVILHQSALRSQDQMSTLIYSILAYMTWQY